MRFIVEIYLPVSKFINLLNKVPTNKKKKKRSRSKQSAAASLLGEGKISTWHLFNWPQWHLKSKICNNINSDTMSSFSKCLLLGLIVFSLQLDEWAQLFALWPWHRNSMHPNRLHDSFLSPLLLCSSHTLKSYRSGWKKERLLLLNYNYHYYF